MSLKALLRIADQIQLFKAQPHWPKPRIHKENRLFGGLPLWVCSSPSRIGFLEGGTIKCIGSGDTPKAAYDDWCKNYWHWN